MISFNLLIFVIPSEINTKGFGSLKTSFKFSEILNSFLGYFLYSISLILFKLSISSLIIMNEILLKSL